MSPSRFVAECRACVAAGRPPQAIAALVAQALAVHEGDEWRRAPELLHREAGLLIVNLTLPPWAASAVHDHGTWAVIGISRGSEIEHFHEERDGALVKTRDVEVKAGHAIVLAPDTIHAISNPSGEPAFGIHVYGRDLVTAPRHMWHPDTGERMAFEMATFERWEAELTRPK